MKRLVLILLAVALVAVIVTLQSPDAMTQIYSVVANGANLPSNTPRAGSLFLKHAAGSDSSLYISTGRSWVQISSAAGVGDITGVTAGSGLQGGGASGGVTLAINHLGLTTDSLAYMTATFLELHAAAWLAAASNGATDTTVSYIPAKSFSASTAETLSVDFILPRTTSVLDSICVFFAVNQTTGDSIGIGLKIRSVALTAAINSAAFSAIDTVIVDMGATANAPQYFGFPISSISGIKRVTVVVWRLPTITNDQTGRAYMVDAYARGKALR